MKETKNLAKSLSSFGVRAAAYKRPPVNRNIFALTILPTHPEGVVTINQGRARVEVAGNKNRRQAVVSVVESGRKITRAVSRIVTGKDKPAADEALDILKANFPIIMPNNTKWSIADLIIDDRGLVRGLSIPSFKLTAYVTARAMTRTTNHFLIGMDETHNFVAPLPKKARNVREAHRMLRPGKLRRGTLRQGEWFFEPCDRKTCAKLEAIATRSSHIVHRRQLSNTTHVLLSAMRANMPRQRVSSLYAHGYVMDDRQGHHRALFLGKWHKVVRNKETTIKVDPAQREMAMRRRRTWD